MSAVWDRTTEVMAARAPTLVSLALLFLWLPQMVKLAVQLALLGALRVVSGTALMPGVALVIELLGIAVVLLALVGQLALVAVASDAARSQGAAIRLALRRFWLYLLCVIVIGIVLVIALLPAVIPIVASYPSIAAMQAGVPPQVSPGTGLFVGLYLLAVLLVGIWLEARVFVLLAPVIANERAGLASFARAFRLTRGLTWRIIGVVLLFAVVTVVAALAVKWVLGSVFALIFGFGGKALVTFLTAAAVALVGCALSVVAASFTARLYLMTNGQGDEGWPLP